VPTDTTSWESVQALVAAAVARFGGVHILVNCAAAPGGLVRNAIELADEDALMLDLNTKLFGYSGRQKPACHICARPGGAASSTSAV
jgi:NAD(P)-dependent dehydrogenase (short-subunit alcohol dehydrogenase family)